MKKLSLLPIVIICLTSCNADYEFENVQEERISRAWGGYRNLTPAEEKEFLTVFPNLDVHNVGVIDDYSGSMYMYNCIGWAMDVKKWIDPVVDMKGFQEQFESAQNYGSNLKVIKTDKLSSSSVVDGWGFVGEMTHASRLYNGAWSSKLGSYYCITHGRRALTSQVYGSVQMSFKNAYSRSLVADTTTVKLSSDEIKNVSLKAMEVGDNIKSKFENLHEEWYKAAQADVKIMLSNSMYARCELPQFKELIEMGDVIIPLVMEKLLDEKYFFSQIILETIKSEDFIIPYEVYYDGTPVLQSAQDRAKRIVKSWNKCTMKSDNK